MLRFPCIGDLHLQHTDPRNADRLQALDQVLDEALALGSIGAWLFLGDLYDGRSSIEDRNDIAPRLQRAAEVAPVVVLYGNHDGHGDLEILARLKARFPIHVIARAGVTVIDIPGNSRIPLALFALPYPHKHALVAAGVANGELGATADAALDAIFIQAAEQLREAAYHGAVPLMIGHATIAGSSSSVGQPMGLDRDIAITPALLDRLGDVPKIFGHIHKPQEIYGAHYAGSVCRNDWGECEDKRWLAVECERTADGWRYDVVSRPVAIAPMYHVEGTLSLARGFEWTVKRGPDAEVLEAPPSWRGADVRVRYRFSESEGPMLEMVRAQLLAEFAEARTLVPDPIVVRERAHRAPEVEAAKTLPERVAAFVRSSGVEWTPALQTKFAALQEPDGAAFMARVKDGLSGAVADSDPHSDRQVAGPHAAPDTVMFDEVTA